MENQFLGKHSFSTGLGTHAGHINLQGTLKTTKRNEQQGFYCPLLHLTLSNSPLGQGFRCLQQRPAPQLPGALAQIK